MWIISPANAASLSGLALTAFLAATILPLSSEAVFGALVLAGSAPGYVLVLVAGTANTAGSCVNYWLGRFLERYRDRRWFPVSAVQLSRAQDFYKRWGWPSLLLSWVPLIGDPLTIAAGFLRLPFRWFLPLVALAKFGRYALVLWLIRSAVLG